MFYLCLEPVLLGDFSFGNFINRIEYFALGVWLSFTVELFEVFSCIELLSDRKRKRSLRILGSGGISEQFNLDQAIHWQLCHSQDHGMCSNEAEVSLQMWHQEANIGVCSYENQSRFGYLLPYDVVTVQRFSQNSVVIAFDLLILQNYIFRVYQAHVGWMKTDIASHEKNVLELVHLAVRADIGTNNGVDALDVEVLLDVSQLDAVLLVENDEVSDDFIAWNLDANSNWWLLAKI